MKPIDLIALANSVPEIMSTQEQIDTFIKGSLHQDYLNELDCRIEYYKEGLVDQDITYTGRDYDVLRGFITNLRNMRELFTDMLMNKGEK